MASPSRPEHARTERVEGPCLDVLAVLADEGLDPLAELAGRAVGERDREDPARRDGLDADQVRDPVGDDAGLARARAREDQERALRRRDRPRLLGVEAADDLLGPRGSPGLDGGRHRLRVERRAGGRELGLDGALAQPLGLLGDGIGLWRRGRAGGLGRRLDPGGLDRGRGLVAQVEPRALLVRLRATGAAALRGLVDRGGTHPPILGWAARRGPFAAYRVGGGGPPGWPGTGYCVWTGYWGWAG